MLLDLPFCDGNRRRPSTNIESAFVICGFFGTILLLFAVVYSLRVSDLGSTRPGSLPKKQADLSTTHSLYRRYQLVVFHISDPK